MNQDLLKALGIILGGILATVAPYIATWVKKRFAKDAEAKSFLHNAEYRVKINEVLVEVRALTGANRVAVMEYHNGNAAMNGLPFNYASMTYEKTDQTTRDMMPSFQKMPISALCEVLLDVHNSQKGYVKVNENYKYEDAVEVQKYYGIDTSYIFRIGNHIKHGTVHIMWINENPELQEEELEIIHYKVMYINELMEKMKKH